MNNLHVRNLSAETKKSDIYDHFKKHIENIRTCQLYKPPSGTFKFAVIQLQEGCQPEQLAELYNGSLLKGSIIIVKAQISSKRMVDDEVSPRVLALSLKEPPVRDVQFDPGSINEAGDTGDPYHKNCVSDGADGRRLWNNQIQCRSCKQKFLSIADFRRHNRKCTKPRDGSGKLLQVSQLPANTTALPREPIANPAHDTENSGHIDNSANDTANIAYDTDNLGPIANTAQDTNNLGPIANPAYDTNNLGPTANTAQNPKYSEPMFTANSAQYPRPTVSLTEHAEDQGPSESNVQFAEYSEPSATTTQYAEYTGPSESATQYTEYQGPNSTVKSEYSGAAVHTLQYPAPILTADEKCYVNSDENPRGEFSQYGQSYPTPVLESEAVLWELKQNKKLLEEQEKRNRSLQEGMDFLKEEIKKLQAVTAPPVRPQPPPPTTTTCFNPFLFVPQSQGSVLFPFQQYPVVTLQRHCLPQPPPSSGLYPTLPRPHTPRPPALWPGAHVETVPNPRFPLVPLPAGRQLPIFYTGNCARLADNRQVQEIFPTADSTWDYSKKYTGTLPKTTAPTPSKNLSVQSPEFFPRKAPGFNTTSWHGDSGQGFNSRVATSAQPPQIQSLTLPANNNYTTGYEALTDLDHNDNRKPFSTNMYLTHEENYKSKNLATEESGCLKYFSSEKEIECPDRGRTERLEEIECPDRGRTERLERETIGDRVVEVTSDVDYLSDASGGMDYDQDFVREQQRILEDIMRTNADRKKVEESNLLLAQALQDESNSRVQESNPSCPTWSTVTSRKQQWRNRRESEKEEEESRILDEVHRREREITQKKMEEIARSKRVNLITPEEFPVISRAMSKRPTNWPKLPETFSELSEATNQKKVKQQILSQENRIVVLQARLSEIRNSAIYSKEYEMERKKLGDLLKFELSRLESDREKLRKMFLK